MVWFSLLKLYKKSVINNKLEQIKENDNSKSKACHDAKIDLCILDTSGQSYFKPSTSKQYLNIITSIIKERLLIS